MIKWISNHNGVMKLGFNSAREAEEFLLKQSVNPDWLGLFNLTFEKVYDETCCIVACPANVWLKLS